MKFPLTTLQKYLDAGLVTRRTHLTDDLYIYNYTPRCQFTHAWDEITTQCRGLIVDGDDNIIAKPFSKFFNLEELKPEEIPAEPFEVFDKADGSLGILYPLSNGKYAVATRGSFHSEQAEAASKLIAHMDSFSFRPDWTYLFEIILPSNRIVVDYGDAKELVWLAVFDTESGTEIPYEYLQLYTLRPPFRLIQRFDGLKDLSHIRDLHRDNAEGFVIRFKSGLRVKVKYEEYVRLHRVLTNVSTKTVWEYLSEGKSFDDLLERVPDEFNSWLRSEVAKQRYSYAEIEHAAYEVFDRVKNIESRKEQASALRGNDVSDIVFKMLDEREYGGLIWKRLRPVYSKPFRIEDES